MTTPICSTPSPQVNDVFLDVEETETNQTSIITTAIVSFQQAFRFTVGSHEPLMIGASPIGFINQSNTTIEECRMQAIHLCQAIGDEHNIDVVYNPTLNFQSTFHQESVILLRSGWDDWFDQNPGSMRIQYCAGRSTYIVRAALKEYPHQNQIIVIAIAPSCPIPQELCFCVRHYRSFGDITSMSGWNSDYPGFTVLNSHPEARTTIDNLFSSSTFMGVLRQEYLRFSLGMRELDPEAPIVPMPPYTTIEVLRLYSSTAEVTAFMRRLSGTLDNNLIEDALNPHIEGALEWSVTIIDLVRRSMMAADIGFVYIFVNTSRRYIYLAMCILQGTNIVRGAILTFIPRHQNRGSILRTFALRTGFLDPIHGVCTIAYFARLMLGDWLSLPFRIGSGVIVFVLTPLFITDGAARWLSSLRGRIQYLIVGADRESSVREVSGVNLPARRVAYTWGVENTVLFGIIAGLGMFGAGLSIAIGLFETPGGTASINAVSQNISNAAPAILPLGNFTAGNASDSSLADFEANLSMGYGIYLMIYAVLSFISVCLHSVNLSRMLRSRPGEDRSRVHSIRGGGRLGERFEFIASAPPSGSDSDSDSEEE